MPSRRAVGIDLGTAQTTVAQCDSSGRASVIRLGQGEPVVPSVVYFEDDELLFGRDAKVAAAAQPGRAAEYSLRDLGKPAYSRALGGELLPVELIEAALLKKLAGELTRDAAPPAAVLALPTSLDQAQRGALADACQMAGLELLGSVSAPLAAAAAFAESQGYLSAVGSNRPGTRVLVFDLGGRQARRGNRRYQARPLAHDGRRRNRPAGRPRSGRAPGRISGQAVRQAIRRRSATRHGQCSPVARKRRGSPAIALPGSRRGCKSSGEKLGRDSRSRDKRTRSWWLIRSTRLSTWPTEC